MKGRYSFITDWELRAPLEEVWQAILESEQWPEWWKGVVDVKELKPGNESGIGSIRSYTLSSPSRYRLRFNLLLTNRTEYQLLKGNATGDLQGTGSWHFRYNDGITYVQCEWHVMTTIPWMSYMGVVLAPFFRYNHTIVMRWGARSLAKKLNCELVRH